MEGSDQKIGLTQGSLDPGVRQLMCQHGRINPGKRPVLVAGERGQALLEAGQRFGHGAK